MVRRVDSNDEVEEEGNDNTIDEDEVGVGEVGVVATVVLEISVEGERSSVIPLPNPLRVFNPDSGLVPIPLLLLLPIPLPPPATPVTEDCCCCCCCGRGLARGTGLALWFTLVKFPPGNKEHNSRGELTWLL